MARDNRTVGRFILSDIPPAPRGVPQVEVTFDMDANGILNVSAKDKGTGKEQSIRIEASTGLSKDEIATMKAEAEANAESDRKAKESAEKINAADTLIFQTEKQLSEFGDKIPDDKKGAIETALEALKEAHKSQDLDAIEKSMTDLNGAWQAASQDIYQAQQQAGGGSTGPETDETAGDDGSTSTGEDVTDVEFEEVEDDNNK